MEIQLLDTDTQQVVFRKHYQGYGLEQSKEPQPLYAAFVNAIDHALADPQFVANLNGAEAGAVADAARPVLTIARCDQAVDSRLPDSIGGLMNAVVGLRAGSVTGSGVIISPDGFILTAAHLVDGRESVVVALAGGMELDASVLRVDGGRDVAILRVPGRAHKCVPVSSELAAIGTDIFAVGTPLDAKLSNSITRGIVSGHREIDGARLLQTDASINPGNSGGPLFNANGRVQAIVSFKAYGPAIEGIAFGVPIPVVTSRLGLDFQK